MTEISIPPAVSIVIPAYNAAGVISRTLESVRAQTYQHYEVIVVDDGSTDGTAEAVARHFERYRMPGRCLRQENKKIAAARNAGLRAARGAFIALLDHDDLWHPDKLSLVLREFQLHPEAGLVCHAEKIVADRRPPRVRRYGPASARMYERLLFGGNAVSPSAAVFKKEKALEIGGFRENPEFNTVEDYDFWMRLSRVARFHFLDRVLGEYRVEDSSVTRRIEYHHANLESVLRDHFASYFGPRPGWLARLRMRRRLSAVYRSALGQLLAYDEHPPRQKEFALKMLRTFPVDPKNLVRAFQWGGRAALRYLSGSGAKRAPRRKSK